MGGRSALGKGQSLQLCLRPRAGPGPRPHLLVPAGQMRCLAAQLPPPLTPVPAPTQSRAQPAGVSPGAPAVAWGRGRQPLLSIPGILARSGNRGWAAGPQAGNRRPLSPGSFLLTSSRGEVGLAQEGNSPASELLGGDLWERVSADPQQQASLAERAGSRPHLWPAGHAPSGERSGRPRTAPRPSFPNWPGRLPAAGPHLAPASSRPLQEASDPPGQAGSGRTRSSLERFTAPGCLFWVVPVLAHLAVHLSSLGKQTPRQSHRGQRALWQAP